MERFSPFSEATLLVSFAANPEETQRIRREEFVDKEPRPVMCKAPHSRRPRGACYDGTARSRRAGSCPDSAG